MHDALSESSSLSSVRREVSLAVSRLRIKRLAIRVFYVFMHELSFVARTIRPVVDYLLWCMFSWFVLFGQVWRNSYCGKWNVDSQLNLCLSTHAWLEVYISSVPSCCNSKIP